MDSYSQVVSVTFKSTASALRARPAIAPLYRDLSAAFSTRMDDNNVDAVRVAEVMALYGQKGTFYLNDPTSWWEDNARSGGAMLDDPARAVPRSLLATGNSIGGHTLSHEYLPAQSKNSAFREIMGIRVALEIQTSTPIHSFTYPFMYFGSSIRGGIDRADLEEMLRRAGFYQLAENKYSDGRETSLQDGTFIVVDGELMGGLSEESIIAKSLGPDARPLFLVTMHPWVRQWGGSGFPKLADTYRRWSGRKDWWYCNINEYAAYTYQAGHTKILASVSGNVLRLSMKRPDPLDLGDMIPLTLTIDDVDAKDVVSVNCPGAEVKLLEIGGRFAFDLCHDSDRKMIAVYGESKNPSNDSEMRVLNSFEGMRAFLFRRENILMLRIANVGNSDLREIRVVFRLPLRWTQGVISRRVETMAPASTTSLEIPLDGRLDADGYSDGEEYCVAQIDFLGERRARLYATCEIHENEPPPFFSRNGFLIMGPLPGDMVEIDPQVFDPDFPSASSQLRDYTVPWGKSLVWRYLDPADAAFLDPDIIPTTGRSNTVDLPKWHSSSYYPHTPVHYILDGRIMSPDARNIRAVFQRDFVTRLSLNGARIDGGELALKKGTNVLRILYTPPVGSKSQFNEHNYGCYFRLEDSCGKRVKDVRFVRPPLLPGRAAEVPVGATD